MWRGMQKRYRSRNDSHNAPAPLLACSLVTFLQEQESHSCCGARNLLFAFARQISTAATPFYSLYPPPAALASVPPRSGANRFDISSCDSNGHCALSAKHKEILLGSAHYECNYENACNGTSRTPSPTVFCCKNHRKSMIL